MPLATETEKAQCRCDRAMYSDVLWPCAKLVPRYLPRSMIGRPNLSRELNLKLLAWPLWPSMNEPTQTLTRLALLCKPTGLAKPTLLLTLWPW